MSFASISRELGVSKSTLIEWSREMSEEVANMRAIHEEALREQYRVAKEHQLKTLSMRYAAVEEELEKRGVSDMPTEKLYGVLFKLIDAMRAEDRPLTLQRTENNPLQDLMGSMSRIESWNG